MKDVKGDLFAELLQLQKLSLPMGPLQFMDRARVRCACTLDLLWILSASCRATLSGDISLSS